MSDVRPFPLIECQGSPRERGRAHGEQARERVRLSAALYGEQLGRLGYDRQGVADLIAKFPASVMSWAPHLIEEIEGIAEGAAIDFTSVFMINARTEVLQIARRAQRARDEPDGCTGAVILPAAAREKRLIHGQNWDWRAECADTGVVLRILRDDGPDILTFTEAGGLMRCGFNSAGLAITANYLESDRDYRALGVPLPFIRRRALEMAHFAMAIRIIATTPKSGSNNIMLSTTAGDAIDLECAPDEAFALYPENDLLVHANHWRSPVALSKLKESGLANVPDSLYRDRRVLAALSARRGDIVAADLKNAFFDSFGSPYAVCRPTIPNELGNLSATVAMIIFEPAKGLMEIAPLPAENRAFTRYELTMDEPIDARLTA